MSVLVIAVVAVSGCGALRAPVEFEPAAAHASEARALRVEPVEGRPSGLVLRMSCACEPPPDGWVEVIRRRGQARAEVYRSVRLDAELADKLRGDGLEFLDRSIAAGQTTTYQIRLREGGEEAPGAIVARSVPLSLRWHAPPPPPKQVRARSALAGTVELRWRAAQARAALVFRRDVLDPKARPERVARLSPAASGVFVDRGVTPGGVYAYRIALARKVTLASETADALQFGTPSNELYVTVRAEPAHDSTR